MYSTGVTIYTRYPSVDIHIYVPYELICLANLIEIFMI